MHLKFESTKQRESLLEEDKRYLKKQFEETNDRKSELEKINNDLLDRNLRLQAAREELIEKYLIDADQVSVYQLFFATVVQYFGIAVGLMLYSYFS